VRDRSRVGEFIILPPRGMRDAAMFVGAWLGVPELRRLPKGWLIDDFRDDGPKLVALTLADAQRLRRNEPSLRVVPVVYYRPALAPRPVVAVAGARPRGAALRKVNVKVVARPGGTAVAGALVVALTDRERGLGAEATTTRRGMATLALPAAAERIERLYVFPARSVWGAVQANLAIASEIGVALDPIDLGQRDAVRHFYRGGDLESGAGVTVGVVDTGVDTRHSDLAVAGGRNTVVGEKPAEYGDNGEMHGTHVAGIIAARGAPPAGVRGIAPGATLRSYRVFGKGSGQASSYAIIKAIDAAVDDGCDLVNMSLGGGAPDEATRAAIEDARLRGTLVIVAAGNGGREPVSFPASDALALAVSAMGRTGTFPAGTPESEYIAPPRGRDKKNFLASFTNVGPEIDLVAPGVAIVSTVPGGFGVMSGTSMACPAATGATARILSGHPEILLGMARDRRRSDAMARSLLAAAKPLGLGAVNEGQGMPEI
jgi:subtilisin